MRGGQRTVAVAMAVALLLAVVACSDDGGPDAGASSTDGSTAPVGTAAGASPSIADLVDLLPLQVSADLRIVDTEDRDVLLRGVNVTSLGDYWQGDPDHPPTQAMTDDDWAEMAATGFSVVRLVISWSLLEPERGQIDEGYLDQIEASVDAAAAHGMYTVIDMHQDAYSATIATEDPAECPEGTRPGKGWDGAPGWATITDGASTCVTGDRNSAPAVVNAWNHFYDDTDGIRTEFVASWYAVAERFAGRPEVAGYDLLNEPEVSRPAAELQPLYDVLLGQTLDAIRQAEADAPFEHLVFVEPAIPAGDPSFGIVIPDPERMRIEPTNVVAAPHNYAESIDAGTLGTIEDTNELFVSVATDLGAATWIGEHGWWDIEPDSLAELDRFAADLDRRALGGAWWQWRQPCGDPHSIPWGGWAEAEPAVITHLHRLGCPGDEDLGPTTELLDVVGRGYPRAVPGRIDELVSDWRTGELTVRASGAEPGAEVVVWTPTSAEEAELVGDGLEDLVGDEVEGGRIVTATVARPDWSLQVLPIGG